METKLKFKVGDKVRVKSLKWYNEKKDSIGHIPIGQVFTDAMSKYCGSILTIKEIFEDIYIVNENTKKWQDWMLEDEVVTEEKQEDKQLNQNDMETKEMTKEEALAFVCNSKIFCVSNKEAEALQRKLFEIGCEWKNINQRKEVITDIWAFHIDTKGKMQHNFKRIKWWSEREEEVKDVEEILNIEIEEKPKFDPNTLQPFEKVLVRDSKNEMWRARFFDTYEEHGDYGEYGTTCNGVWVYCIPYNEETKHLHGTTEEAPEFYNIWK